MDKLTECLTSYHEAMSRFLEMKNNLTRNFPPYVWEILKRYYPTEFNIPVYDVDNILIAAAQAQSAYDSKKLKWFSKKAHAEQIDKLMGECYNNKRKMSKAVAIISRTIEENKHTIALFARFNEINAVAFNLGSDSDRAKLEQFKQGRWPAVKEYGMVSFTKSTDAFEAFIERWEHPEHPEEASRGRSSSGRSNSSSRGSFRPDHPTGDDWSILGLPNLGLSNLGPVEIHQKIKDAFRTLSRTEHPDKKRAPANVTPVEVATFKDTVTARFQQILDAKTKLLAKYPPPPRTGGAAITKTAAKVLIKGRERCVYKGKHNKTYVKMNGVFVALSGIKR